MSPICLCITQAKLTKTIEQNISGGHAGGKKSKVKEAKELGYDLGKEIEKAVEKLSTFEVPEVSKERNTPLVVRSEKATWINIANAVEQAIGHGFQISEATIRHCCIPHRKRSKVARLHRPIANVSHQRFERKEGEANVDGHFSSWFVKQAIMFALQHSGPVVSWDDHSIWDLCKDTYQKLGVVMLQQMKKTAPYADATPMTAQSNVSLIQCLCTIPPLLPLLPFLPALPQLLLLLLNTFPIATSTTFL